MDLTPFLSGERPEARPHRSLFWRRAVASAAREGDWKLIEYFEDGRLELFNLAEDIGEKRNLAASQPDKAKEMHEKIRGWRKRTKAPVPTEKNPGFRKG